MSQLSNELIQNNKDAVNIIQSCFDRKNLALTDIVDAVLATPYDISTKLDWLDEANVLCLMPDKDLLSLVGRLYSNESIEKAKLLKAVCSTSTGYIFLDRDQIVTCAKSADPKSLTNILVHLKLGKQESYIEKVILAAGIAQHEKEKIFNRAEQIISRLNGEHVIKRTIKQVAKANFGPIKQSNHTTKQLTTKSRKPSEKTTKSMQIER